MIQAKTVTLSLLPNSVQAASFLPEGSVSLLGAGVARFAAALCLSNGVTEFIAPKTMLKLYNAPTGPMNTYLFTVTGTATMSYAVTILCSLFTNMTHIETIGYSVIPWILDGWKNAISRTDKKLGVHPSNYLITALFGPIISYLCVSGRPSADMVAKVFAGFMTLNGVTLFSATDLHVKAWGGRVYEDEPIVGSSLQALGLHILSYGVMMVCLIRGVDPVRGVGFSWIPMMVCTGLPLVGSTARKFKLSTGAIGAWMIPNLVIIVSTLSS